MKLWCLVAEEFMNKQRHKIQEIYMLINVNGSKIRWKSSWYLYSYACADGQTKKQKTNRQRDSVIY